MASTRTKFRRRADQVKRGELVKVARGLYVSPDEFDGIEGDFYRATLLCGRRSVICLASALEYYGLSERMGGKTWIMVPRETHPPRRKFLRPFRSRNPQWKLGVENRAKFRVTGVERSIVDAFRYHRLVGASSAVYALKTALKEKQTTKSKLYEMARSLGADKILLPYLEAL